MATIKKTTIVIILLLCVVLFFNQFSATSYSNSTGAPPAKTGSPADVSNCADCHASFPQTLPGIISSNVPSSGYIPGNTYTITVSLVNTGSIIANKIGLEVSPQDSMGNPLGTLIVLNTMETQLVGNGNYITHTVNGTTPDSLNHKSWMFNWIAPVSGTGNVTFYGSFLFANGNATNTGDQGILSTLTIPENATGIKDNLNQKDWFLYPNPCTNNIVVHSLKGQKIKIISIYDLNGKSVKQLQKMNSDEKQVIDVSDLKSGVYFLSIENEWGKTLKKIIKN